MVAKRKFWRRKKKKNNLKNLISISIIFVLIVIGISFWATENIPDNISWDKNWNSSWKNSADDQNGSISWDQERFYIGDKRSLEWEIQKDGVIGFYTHILKTEEGKKIGIKSKTFNLNEYDWKIAIKGEVENIKDDIPIIEVKKIQQEETEKVENWSWEDTKKYVSKHYFSNQGLYFDFLGKTWFDTKISQDGKIIVQETISSDKNQSTSTWAKITKNNILSISSFQCDENSSSKNCSKLKERFEKLWFESFVSSNSIKLYQISETNKWMFFNDNLWGYNITPIKSKSIIQLSKYINLITPWKIKEQLSSNIENICKKSDMKIENIQKFQLKIENEQLRAQIEWEDNNNNIISCVLDLELGETIVTKLESIQKIGKNETKSSNKDNKSETDNKTENINLDIADKDSLSFESKRGFEIIFPSKNIAYMWEYLDSEKDFGINSIKCKYKINVSYYKNKDSLENNPWIEIFECETELNESNIQKMIKSQNLIYKNSWSGKNFLIKTNKKDFNEFVEKIQIK